MFDGKTKELILQAVKNEHEKACSEWGNAYNSAHEGWAVVNEELDEVKFEIEMIRTDFMMMWQGVRHNTPKVIAKSADDMMAKAINAMMELAQVAACCMKMKKTVEG